MIMTCYICSLSLRTTNNSGEYLGANEKPKGRASKRLKKSKNTEVLAKFLKLVNRYSGLIGCRGKEENFEGEIAEREVCIKCLEGLEVVLCQSNLVDKTEERVRKLQRQLLEELKILKGQLDSLHNDLEVIWRKFRASDGNGEGRVDGLLNGLFKKRHDNGFVHFK